MRDAVGVLLELEAEALAERDPIGQRHARPLLVGAVGAGHHAFDRAGLEQGPLGDDLAGVGIVDAMSFHGAPRKPDPAINVNAATAAQLC